MMYDDAFEICLSVTMLVYTNNGSYKILDHNLVTNI